MGLGRGRGLHQPDGPPGFPGPYAAGVFSWLPALSKLLGRVDNDISLGPAGECLSGQGTGGDTHVRGP